MSRIFASIRASLLELSIPELSELLLLFVVALISFVIQVIHILPHPAKLFEDAQGITLILLSILALHFFVQRITFMQKLERGMDFLKLVGVRSFPKNLELLIEDFVKTNGKLQRLKGRAKNRNPQFCSIADDLLGEQALRLKELADGKLSIPRNRKLILHQQLINNYKIRFDSISDNQLSYWAGTENDSVGYLKISKNAVLNEKTVASRIFILKLDELISRSASVISVLETHEKNGIGWGVAVRDFLSQETERERRLDFSLYDTAKAVSFFNMEDMRYETIFATTKTNVATIAIYEKIYIDLISQCWLISKRFEQNYLGMLPSGRVREEMEIKARTRNDRIDKQLRQKVTQHETFVLMSCGYDEINKKVTRLVEIINAYKAADVA
jgi:hypothetical protein